MLYLGTPIPCDDRAMVLSCDAHSKSTADHETHTLANHDGTHWIMWCRGRRAGEISTEHTLVVVLII